jgi:hypothetical protein
MAGQYHFQWQNPILLKSIYPMRESKLRDFLGYSKEVDLWAEYKNRDISSLTEEVQEYESSWKLHASQSLKIFHPEKLFHDRRCAGIFFKIYAH